MIPIIPKAIGTDEDKNDFITFLSPKNKRNEVYKP